MEGKVTQREACKMKDKAKGWKGRGKKDNCGKMQGWKKFSCMEIRFGIEVNPSWMWLTYNFSPQNPNIIHQRGDENTQTYQLLVVIQHQFLLTICKEMAGSWRGEITIKSCE